MQINHRQRKIIQLLLNHSIPIHGSVIVQSLGSTTRTLRQDIAFINSVFNKINLQIRSNPSKGYWIEEADKYSFSSSIKQEKKDVIPANQNQREIAVCFYLLEHDEEYTSMGMLADLIYVSKTTISNTIRHIQEIIQASKGLQLIISTQKGLQLNGSEYDKRNLYSSIMLLFYELENEYINQFIQVMYDRLRISEALYEVTTEYLIHHNRMLTNKSLMITINEVLISVYRSKIMHHEMDGSMKYNDRVSLPFDRIEQMLNLTVSEADKDYLYHMMAKKRTYGAHGDQRPDETPNHIIEAYYEEVETIYHLSLHEHHKLTEHIAAMIYYHQTYRHADDHELRSIRNSHPFAYEVAALMNPILQKHTQKVMTETELNSLTARISVILDRQIKKFNIVILTNQSTSLSELLSVELNVYFGQILNIIGIYPFYSIASIPAFEQIDFLLATSRELIDQNVDVLYINPVLTMEDIQYISKYINIHTPSYKGIKQHD